MDEGPLTGLGDVEAAAILKLHVPTTLREAKSPSLATVAIPTLRGPMGIILLAVASLYLFVSALEEGLVPLVGALAIALVMFQDARRERALIALRQLAEAFPQLVQVGMLQRIAARHLTFRENARVVEGERG